MFECRARRWELGGVSWLHVRVGLMAHVNCYNTIKGLRRRLWELCAMGGAASWRCAMAGVARWGVPHIGAWCVDERDIHRELITCACTARNAHHSLLYDHGVALASSGAVGFERRRWLPLFDR